MRGDEGGAVGRRRTAASGGLLVAEAVEAIAEERRIEAKNLGQRRNSRIHVHTPPDILQKIGRSEFLLIFDLDLL